MDISNYNIEQCDAVSVLNAIMDIFVQRPVSRAVKKMDEVKTEVDTKAAEVVAAVQAMDPDIAEGKQNMAAAINTKYPSPVASADQSLNQMAKEVRTIAQTPIYIDGGEMYAAQLTGNGTLWDLYQVLNDMKNTFLKQAYGDNDFVYKCLIVAEYYKGNDSMQLRLADGYYTSDGVYYNDVQHLHPWNDANDGKANRWVCFLYKSEAPSITFDSKSTDISPRSMYIGGHIGTIAYQTNGRLTELVCGVEETDVVDNFLSNSYTQAWNNNIIMRGVKNIISGTSGTQFVASPSTGMLYFDSMSNIDVAVTNELKIINADSLSTVIINGLKSFKSRGNAGFYIVASNGSKTREIVIPDLETVDNPASYQLIRSTTNNNCAFEIIDVRSLKVLPCYLFGDPHGGISLVNVKDVIVGAMETNLNLKYWYATNVLADTDKKARLIENIKNHILARVSDRSETTFLNFTVSTNMCNAIKDELVEWPIGSGTQMTLYNAFQTKGWNLLGA